MTRNVTVFDIDGTLADISHRLHFIEGKNPDWEKFKTNHENDEPIKTQWLLLKTLYQSGREIMFITGRSENERHATFSWLQRMMKCYLGQVFSISLFMRKEGDFRPDTIVKKEIHDLLVSCGIVFDMVFEDRTKVVKMWRGLGIPCLQVADGDY